MTPRNRAIPSIAHKPAAEQACGCDLVAAEKAVVRCVAEICDFVGAHFDATKIRQFTQLLRCCAGYIEARVPVDEQARADERALDRYDEQEDGADEWGTWWGEA